MIELTIYLGQHQLSVTFGVSRHPKFNPDKLAIGWACLVPMVQDCFTTTVCLKRVLPNGHEITGNW